MYYCWHMVSTGSNAEEMPYCFSKCVVRHRVSERGSCLFHPRVSHLELILQRPPPEGRASAGFRPKHTARAQWEPGLGMWKLLVLKGRGGCLTDNRERHSSGHHTPQRSFTSQESQTPPLALVFPSVRNAILPLHTFKYGNADRGVLFQRCL